jgi:hypothetical protein
MGKILNVKNLLIIFIIILAGYLTSEFPDESVLVIGCSAILIIGIWLLQVEKENE